MQTSTNKQIYVNYKNFITIRVSALYYRKFKSRTSDEGVMLSSNIFGLSLFVLKLNKISAGKFQLYPHGQSLSVSVFVCSVQLSGCCKSTLVKSFRIVYNISTTTNNSFGCFCLCIN